MVWEQPHTMAWLSPSSNSTPVHKGKRVHYPIHLHEFLFVIRKICLCGTRKILRKKSPNPQKHVPPASAVLKHFHLDWLLAIASELLNIKFQNRDIKEWTWNEQLDSALHAVGHVFLKWRRERGVFSPPPTLSLEAFDTSPSWGPDYKARI